MKPLLEPLELLFSVGSYEWLSSVACAELCVRQRRLVPAKSKCAQHNELAFNNTLDKRQKLTTNSLRSRTEQPIELRNGLSID